jgi:MFS family permease
MFPEPREQAKAIGVYSFVASAGGSIGLLLGGALTEAIVEMSTNRTNDLLAEGTSQAVALTDGFKLAFLIGAGIAVLAIVVAATVLQPPAAVAEAEPAGDSELPAPPDEVPQPALSSEAA